MSSEASQAHTDSPQPLSGHGSPRYQVYFHQKAKASLRGGVGAEPGEHTMSCPAGAAALPLYGSWRKFKPALSVS